MVRGWRGRDHVHRFNIGRRRWRRWGDSPGGKRTLEQDPLAHSHLLRCANRHDRFPSLHAELVHLLKVIFREDASRTRNEKGPVFPELHGRDRRPSLGLSVMLVRGRNEADADSTAAQRYQPVQRNRAHFVHSCFSSLDVASRRSIKSCLEYRAWGVATDRQRTRG